MNPIAFLYFMLGLFAVVAMAMCAATVVALEHAGDPWRHRRPRTFRLPGLGMVRREILRRRSRLWPTKHLAPGLRRMVADAQARVGRRSQPGIKGLAEDERVVPPTAIAAIPPMDAGTFTQRAAQYRQALTPEQRWPELQRQWSMGTGEFPAYIDAMAGQ